GLIRGETAGVLVQKLLCSFFMILTPSSGVTLFTSCSHPVSVLPACGFRLEITPQPHKKKSELYFVFSRKKILTQNHLWHCGRFPSVRIVWVEENLLGEGYAQS